MDPPVSNSEKNRNDMSMHRVSVDLVHHISGDEHDGDVSASDLSSPPSPGMLSPTGQSVFNTESVLAETQLSLCKRSADLHLNDMTTVDTSTLWSIVSNHEEEEALHPPSPDEGLSHKALKTSSMSDAPSSINMSMMESVSQTLPDSIFDSDGATSTAQFVFTKFGADVPGIFTFSANSKDTTTTSNVITAR